MSSTPPNESTNQPGSPVLPPRVPDHELLRRIGRGAYGEVWIARSVTGAFRAVKVVHRQSFDHDRPFEREFEGIQKFEPISRKHDSQVDILHVGRGDDCFYYVMELADDQATGGQINPDNYAPRTLKSDLMFHGRLPFEESVRIGVALTTALEHLHGHGLVHRDVKPSNIIFVNGVPKLADIGLVTGVDATRSYVGTEGFAAPEGPGSPQGDIYSLGKVLYEMGTGKDRQEFPELPTQLRELPDREGLMELNAVVAKACRHDPKDRYASAAAMRADLELLQGGKSLARLHRLEHRLRFVRQAGAVVTAVAVLALAAWWFQALQTRAARALAEDNRRLATENAERVRQLNVAHGVRYMDEGDLGSSLLWFAAALKQATNDLARAETYRFRLASLLQLHPKLAAVIPLRKGPKVFEQFVQAPFVVAPEGRRMLARTGSGLEVWGLDLPPHRMLEVPNGEDWSSFDITKAGDRFYVSSPDRRSQIWTLDSKGKDRMVEANGPPLLSACFAAAGKWLVGITTNRTFVRFDAETGSQDGPPIELGDYLDSDHSRNADWYSFLYANGATRVLDVLNRRLLDGPKVGPESVAVTPVLNGQRLLIWEGRDTESRARLRLWDTSTGKEVGVPILLRQDAGAWCFSPDMTRLALTSEDQTARVWSLITGDPLSPPLVHPTRPRGIAWSADGTRVVTTGMDGVVRVWDVRSGQPATPPLLHGGATKFASFGPDDAFLLVADASGVLRIWDLASRDSAWNRLPLAAAPQAVAISPNGEVLATFVAGETTLWNRKGFQRLASFQALSGSFEGVHFSGLAMGLHFSPDSHYLAAPDQTNGARVWDAHTAQPAGPRLTHGTNYVVEASFSPDGHELATVGRDDATVHFWNWRDGTETRPPLALPSQAKEGEWAPRQDRLVVRVKRGPGGVTTLWDLDKRALLGEPVWCNGSYKFSPDGGRLAVADPFTNVRLIDSTTGALLCEPLQHSSFVLGLDFSPDGKRLVTGSHDRTIVIWDATNGRKLLTLGAADEPVTDVFFVREGRWVAAWSDSGKARLWSSTDNEPLTPWMQIGEQSGVTALDPKRLLFAASLDRGINLYEFAPTLAPAKTLVRMAELVSGREPAGDGSGLPTTAEHLFEIHDELRGQNPGDFQVSATLLARWHDRQTIEGPSLDKLESALYHLDRLSQLQPTNSVLRDRLTRMTDLRVPPRDPAASPRLIDLSALYTESFGTPVEMDFNRLPVGLHRLAGTEFDLRGLVLLHQADPQPQSVAVGDRVSYIPVLQRCARLHFLQGVTGSAPQGAEVARWIIHYADGVQRVWPVRYGEHLRQGLQTSSESPELSHATLAWQGENEPPRADAALCLYKATWENPQPDVEITYLEFQIGDAPPEPFVVAITAE